MSDSPLPRFVPIAAMAAVLFVCAVARAAETKQGDPGVFDVRQYGARGDGKTLDTAAVQRAIDACHEAGGGTVMLARGAFLSGTIVLKSHVTLRVEAGAVLRGSLNIDDYPDHTPQIESLYRPRFTKSLIYAERAEGIGLCGQGLIDGQGEHFPAKPGDDKGRPYILRFSECTNVRVRDVSFRNSARWLSHYLACEDVVIDGITIRARIRENRDGIDVDSCTNVRIANCDIDSGDDSIVLKSTALRPCRRVTVTNCVLTSMATALKLGTESNGGFEDVTFSNCTIHDTGGSGIGIMTVDGGKLERVAITNITMTNVAVPLFIRLGNRARPLPDREPQPVGSLRGVTISNIEAGGAAAIGCSVTGIPGAMAQDITLRDIRIRFAGGGTAEDAGRKVDEKEASYPKGWMFGTLPAYGLYCRHVKGLTLANLDFTFEEEDHRPAIVCDDVEDLDLSGLRARLLPSAEALVKMKDVRGALVHGCRPGAVAGKFLEVTGERSSGITLVGQRPVAGTTPGGSD